MKRRDLLKLGAVAGVSAAVADGCISSSPVDLEDPASHESAQAFLALLDRQLPVLDRARFIDRYLADAAPGPRSAAVQKRIDEHDAVFRRMMRTLFISQSFRDLSPAAQLHPTVQERMLGHVDEIGATVFEVGDMLAALDAPQRDRMQSTLRDRPDLPMAMAERLSKRAALTGVSRARRLQVRSMMAQTSFRLKHGDPGVVIDEYVAKVERVRAQGATDATALALAERLGEKAFWRYQRHVVAAPGSFPAGEEPPARKAGTATGTGTGATAPPATEPAEPERRGRGGMKTGAYMMGIGVLVFGVSALLISTTEAFGFVFGLTAGVVLFGIGLLTLLISALVYATSG